MMPESRVTSEHLSAQTLSEYTIENHTAKYVPKENRDAGHVSNTTQNVSRAEGTGEEDTAK
jgi:hypothetical protein